MAYFSLQCAACRDRTKRCAGSYSGRDEDRRPYEGPMYLCENAACRINAERLRSEKQFLKQYWSWGNGRQ